MWIAGVVLGVKQLRHPGWIAWQSKQGSSCIRQACFIEGQNEEMAVLFEVIDVRGVSNEGCWLVPAALHVFLELSQQSHHKHQDVLRNNDRSSVHFITGGRFKSRQRRTCKVVVLRQRSYRQHWQQLEGSDSISAPIKVVAGNSGGQRCSAYWILLFTHGRENVETTVQCKLV